jgi:hypothetical protein
MFLKYILKIREAWGSALTAAHAKSLGTAKLLFIL